MGKCTFKANTRKLIDFMAASSRAFDSKLIGLSYL